MIDAWHLVWIVPLVGTVCYALGVCMATGKEADPPRDSALREDNYCAECPFAPEGDENHG